MTAITAFLAAVGAGFAGFQKVQANLGIPPLQCAALIAAPLLLLFFLHTLPSLRERRKKLALALITGATQPGYFQLSAREDEESFQRADGKHEEVLKWLSRPPGRVLYLTGSSGTGKTSLLTAWVLPSLEREGVRVIRLRGYQDPAQALEDELRRPGAVWKKSPPETTDLSSLFDQAVERLRPARILVIFDQFEEFLILQEQQHRRRFVEFLAAQAGMRECASAILLVFRAEYDGFIQELNLPLPIYGQNLQKVSAFTQRAAQDFLAASGLKIEEDLRADVLREAAELEETRGMIRPIILNLCGLVLERFSTGLPHAFRPGRLIRGFVRETIFDRELGEAAPTLLRKLISPQTTKKPCTIDELAKGTTLTPRQAQGVMFKLSAPERGMVHALDPDYRIWEISHDFLVPIIDSMLAGWKVSVWTKIRPWLPVGYLAAFLLLLFAAPRLLPDPKAELIRMHWEVVDLDGRTPWQKYVLKEGVKLYLFYVSMPPPESVQALNRLEENYGVQLENIGSFDHAHFRAWKNLKRLTVLDLSDKEIYEFSGLKDLPASLTTLKIQGYQFFTDDKLADLPRFIKSLKLEGSKITDTGLKNLPLSLVSLGIISNTTITDGGLKNLNSLASLASLDLKGDERITDAGLKNLPPSLTSLNLSYARITDDGLKNLPTSLTWLDLSSDNRVTDAGFQNLKSLRSLTSLELFSSKITDAGLKDLPQSLTSLNLTADFRITDEGLKSLPPSLESLNMSLDRQITDAGLADLPRSLTSLDLSQDYNITDNGLKNLKFLTSLTSLDLSYDDKITDSGLTNLPPSLTSLVLRGDRRITDAGLKTLASSVKVIH